MDGQLLNWLSTSPSRHCFWRMLLQHLLEVSAPMTGGMLCHHLCAAGVQKVNNGSALTLAHQGGLNLPDRNYVERTLERRWFLQSLNLLSLTGCRVPLKECVLKAFNIIFRPEETPRSQLRFALSISI